MTKTRWACLCLYRQLQYTGRLHVRFQGDWAGAAAGVPQVLVNKARGLAVEHELLSKKLAGGFDARTSKRIGEIAPVTNALKAWEDAQTVCTGSLQETN